MQWGQMQLTISTPANVLINNNYIFLMKLQVDIEEAAKRTSILYIISESPQEEGNCKISL